MSSFIYFLRESLRGFTRNLSTTLGSIVTIFLSLLIIGIFLIGGIIVDNVMSGVENEVSITAFISDDAAEEDVTSLQSYLESIPDVKTVTFVSKEQALENFRSTSNSDIIDTLDGQNPLPASFEIELSDPQLVTDVANNIAGNELFKKICDDPENPPESLKYGQQTVERLFTLVNYIRYIGIALIALLIFIALVFINNTIRLAILARRKEIAIMRLVGASNNFIRGPFLMEGALHALIGAALAIGVLEALHMFVLPVLQQQLLFLNFNIGAATFVYIYLILTGSGLVIGLIGSALAMRRYLKV
ncbi:permease-like cell division protein FtsX [Xiamenia xianingshaonis]|uniref:Cell division protein FtsX n=1 Tax=Xiamenia xianingshaonis TaxID=2682776 RepID=A0A9E6MP65_9ACTN|nr:permease-like cell division protein FtsX [Xiamenia xianingshaonis]NHM14486.1 FtsX-like permease family protein [Xiamenia xianingshaonis]QTU83778.1 permease-like cell division protein FtsX [Xiamenia xianingshaonis]